MDITRDFSRLLIAGALCLPAMAMADFPDKPLKLVVATAPGSVADLLGRVYAEKVKNQVGQPVIVDNKPGATGAIGADAVAKSPADGYTLLLHSSALVINPWIAKQPFDFLKDLTPVARTAETPYIITISATLPFQDLAQFVAYAKQNPGKLSCGTYGVGSPPHLSLELLKQAAGVNILHVPYKSSGQALPDLFSGQLSCLIEPPPGSVQHVKSGRLRVIAHTGDTPNSAFPGVEPVGKRYPAATVVGWQAVFAPSGTPKPVLDRLRTEWAKAIASPEVEQKIREAGFQTQSGSFDDFSKTVLNDYDKFGKIIKETGIKLE